MSLLEANVGEQHPTLNLNFYVQNKQVFTSVYTGQINKTGATSGAGTAYRTRAPEFSPGFQWGSCYFIFSFMCMFCRSLFVLLSFFFWSLCCLSFDLQILITPLVSLNSSSYNGTLFRVRFRQVSLHFFNSKYQITLQFN